MVADPFFCLKVTVCRASIDVKLILQIRRILLQLGFYFPDCGHLRSGWGDRHSVIYQGTLPDVPQQADFTTTCRLVDWHIAL
jgi:hypothetical protein